MKHLLILAVHLLATIAKLVRPGGVRAVVAESLLLKHQLLISSRTRRRTPNLNSFDRLLLGLGSLFVPPSRIPKLAVILKPRTLFRFHEALKKCKYRGLFSSGGHRRPGPKGPSKELIDAIVEIKRRNPRGGDWTGWLATQCRWSHALPAFPANREFYREFSVLWRKRHKIHLPKSKSSPDEVLGTHTARTKQNSANIVH
jgi:hypothetical protein